MNLKLIKLIPYLVCFILGIFLWKGCTDNRVLRDELKQIKQEGVEMVQQIEQVKEENALLLSDVVSYESKIDSLENQVENAKKIKSKVETKVIESIKYVEVENDTIKDLMLLNAQNDTIIRGLEMISSVKDSIILAQNKVIQNGDEIQDQLHKIIEKREASLIQMNKELREEKRKKMFWQTTSAGLGIALVTVLII